MRGNLLNPWSCDSPAARLGRILKCALVVVLAGGCMLLAGDPPRANGGAGVAAPPAGGDESGRLIRLEGHEFDPLAGPPSLPPELRYGQPGRDEIAYYIVQFNDRVTPAAHRDLYVAGAVPLHYIHDNAFLVKADGAAIDRVKGMSSVRWVGLFEPAYKLGPRLARDYDDVLNRQLAASDRADSGRSRTPIDTTSRLAVHIMTMEVDRVADVAGAVRKAGGSEVRSSMRGLGLVRAEIPRGALEALAREPGVLWIERELPVEVSNDIARWTIQSSDSETMAAPIHDHGLTGTGQTITVTDTGLDYNHNAFQDGQLIGPAHRKITGYYTPPGASGDGHDNGTTQHGTHVSGSVAGDDGGIGQYDGDGVSSGNTSLEALEPHDGQAFGAKIQMQDISNDPLGRRLFPSSDLATHYAAAIGRDSWIDTNSWGSRGSLGQYTVSAATTDDFIWNHPEFTVLFAAGNQGPFLGTINPFATAKNLITVGASGNGAAAGSPSSFSSRGPTADGRIKPDLMAPGSGLWSVRGCQSGSGCKPSDFNTYQALSGTSMATPTVAGAAALIRQYYMDGWYPNGDPSSGTPFTPSAALIKATLINSAVEMTSPAAYANGEERYPNDNQGWGRILLDNGLYFPGDSRNLLVAQDPGVIAGQTKSYQFSVGNPFEPFKVTLVWTDRPRTAPTTPDLINDLDLVATGPDGTIYRGNAFEGFDPGESRRNAPVSGADHLNNVENILVVSNLRVGLWTISVTGHDVPYGDAQGRQPYALVMTGQLNGDSGVVALDRNEYLSSEVVNVLVLDANLNQDSNTVETAIVQVTSDTETLAETLTLFETSAGSGVFGGSIPLQNSQTPVHGDPYLQVRNRDKITALYFDADDGAGGSGTRQATATVDEDPPVITGVAVTNLQPRRATITWTTDEPADSSVSYGTSLPLTGTASDNLMGTGHVIELRALVPGATYLFQVRSNDEHGTARTDDNGGSYYTFSTPTSSSVEPSPDWATYQNSSARTGASVSMILPPLTPQWSVANNTANVRNSSPVVSGGIVYTAEGGYVRARYASSGALLWERQLGDPFQQSSTPAVSGGVVYVPIQKTVEDEYYGILVRGFLHALDAADGTPIWSYTSSIQGIDTSFILAVDGGLVFTKDTAEISSVLAVNASSGIEAWRYSQPGLLPYQGAAAGDGKVFIALVVPGGGGVITALDQATGAARWSTLGLGLFPGHVPLFAHGTVYIGGGLNGNPSSTSMLAIDAEDGTTRWEAPDFDQILSAPAYDGATLYFATASSAVTFAAVDSTSGDRVWLHTVSAGSSYARSSLAYANGHLYAVTDSGTLRTFDAVTGVMVHSIPVGEQTNSAHLAIADGLIFVEGLYGTLFAFRAQEDPDDDNDGDPDDTDCAPLDPSRHHGAIERCNGFDDNCDGGVDEGFPNHDFDPLADCVDPDDDNDGDPDVTDCGPLLPDIHHGAVEYCNGTDDDCDGAVDEGYSDDFDQDGILDCIDPDDDNDGVQPPADCNDRDATIPAPEDITNLPACRDFRDNDCDQVIDYDCATDATGFFAQLQTQVAGSINEIKAQSTNNVYQSVTEGGGGTRKRMSVIYTFPGVNNLNYILNFEGFKNNTTENFSFSYANSGACGTDETYTNTIMSVVRIGSDNNAVQTTGVGTVTNQRLKLCIKLSDTTADSSADTVSIDRLYLTPGDTVNCPDADTDGYTTACGGCFNQFCPLLDCDDTNAQKSPGRTEGPPGNATCSDGIDNDCNTFTDLDDREQCLVAPPDVVASGEVLTTGTKTGDFTLTQTSNSQHEVLKEAAVSGKSRLVHTWTFTSVPAGSAHKLRIEGHKESFDDNFVFLWSSDNVTFNPISGGTISQALVDQVLEPGFATGALSGTVYIRVQDSDPSNTSKKLDIVRIDHLAIKTVP